MRTLSSAVFLVLLLGSCGLKGPIYMPKDPSLCLGCFENKVKSKIERKEAPLGKEKSKLEGQEESLDKEKFKYIPKVKGQKN
jgi:predicted small lipoprotein YifL